MEVHVLIYDLSGGMARQMSLGMLGFQLDAIYHTSILLNGLEYVYDGHIVAIKPGSSHLGNPLDRELLGTTQLPMDVIETYLDSLRSVYTPEAYNLWRHNCNNFSNDFATFLVGKGIPDKIINMPAEVLESPFGRMLMPALDQQVRASKQQNGGGILGIQNGQQAGGSSAAASSFRVREVSNLSGLDALLSEARSSCAVVFFTSATCGPCRMLYPLYEELAEEVADKGLVIKADISIARDVATRYSITATPTFITFLKGEQENRWMGADASALRGNVRLLVQMAWLRHPHQSLRLPSLHKENPKPVLFTKVPPLPKLLAKMGTAGDDPAVQGVVKFIEARSKDGAAEAHLPDVAAFSAFVASSVESLSPDSLFPLVDILRCGLVDPRLSGCFAEEPDHKTVTALLTHVNGLGSSCPYPLRLVTLQAACNLFSSTLYWGPILSHAALRSQVILLISSSFLDEAHTSVRVAAASVLFNLAVVNGAGRRRGSGSNSNGGDLLSDDDQIELAASVVEAIAQEEESREALEGMLLALGHLVYRLPLDSELVDLMKALDAKTTVLGKKAKFKGMALIDEIGAELLGSVAKGSKTPAR
ncbi:hypothetical protein MAPG_07421 [Magnaporthiopsis poae ATCC 64411]|uniref:Thioredoxin n=1 Tax=Magnaporthiopsis poae (strain ATCC 64411 / 73-15) TaxID=644358 RepID=A0A0C4E4M4_MAGP6|nr:hypothetical protein MAPG_07421 [Magnaporthiopsis poae ATCC 64411]